MVAIDPAAAWDLGRLFDLEVEGISTKLLTSRPTGELDDKHAPDAAAAGDALVVTQHRQ